MLFAGFLEAVQEWVQVFKGTWFCGYMGVQIHGGARAWVYKFMGVRVYGSTGAWECEGMGV